MTSIEWTEKTWNPIVGCSIESPGCTNCYAMKQANRLANMAATPQYHGTVKKVNGKPVWTGEVGFSESTLLQPLKRKKPTTYFVNSMGDLFHQNVPDEWIDRVFAVMALCPQHTFQVLTKQAGRMQEYLDQDDVQIRICSATVAIAVGEQRFTNQAGIDGWWPLPNVWLGVSVEDQARADERIPHLLNTPAAIRFVSAEPLLGPVDIGHYICCSGVGGVSGWDCHPDCPHGKQLVNWVIVGGESGPNARPMHPDWARSIRDQCEMAGVPFLFKQWGEWISGEFGCAPDVNFQDGSWMDINTLPDIFLNDKWTEDWVNDEFEGHAIFHRIGKKAAGRHLDGREWNQMPEVKQ